MRICRINDYQDSRFRKSVLYQHGAFVIDNNPYEVEIINAREAVVTGANRDLYEVLIHEFRVYAPHIHRFYSEAMEIIAEYENLNVVSISLDSIQPSQFYIDTLKLDAVKTFIKNTEDIVIQVMKYGDKYICTDGHTRLYLAATMGAQYVKAIITDEDKAMYFFVQEANRRNIYTAYDLELISHEEYNEKWLSYCKNL